MAQSKKDKVEIGVQSTSLTVFPPDVQGDETKAEIGGRVLMAARDSTGQARGIFLDFLCKAVMLRLKMYAEGVR